MIKFRMRKYLARVLLPFLTVWLCVMPGRAYALLPLPIALVLYGGSASAGGTAVGAGAVSWGLLLGAAFAFIGVSDSNGNQGRLPLTSDPTKAVPAPDASPTAALGQSLTYYGFGPVVTFDWNYVLFAGSPSSSYLQACGNIGGSYLSWNMHCVLTQAQCSSVGYSGCTGSVEVGGGSVLKSAECPSGYILSGGVCNLVDARLALPDNNCDYTRSGSALAVLSDPDCGGGAQLVDCNADGSSCFSVGVNPVTGRPRTIEIHTNPDGGSEIIVRDENLIGNTTITESTTVAVSPDGTIEAVTGETTTGSLPAPGTAPVGTPVTPAASIEFPNDYARTGEAQTAANTLAPKLDTLHHDLSDTATVDDPLAIDPSTMPSFGSTFDNLKSWNLPAHASTCPAPDIDLSGVFGAGNVFSFNAHCQLVQDHFAALQAAMMVAWSMLALFVVLRA